MSLRLASMITTALALVACATTSPRPRPATSGPAATEAPAASADAPAQGGVAAASPPPSAGAPPVDADAQARLRAMVAAAGQEPPVPTQPSVTGIPACDRYTAALVAAMRCAPPGSGMRGRLAEALDEVVATIHDVPASQADARALLIETCTTGADAIEVALAAMSCVAAVR